MRKPFRIVLVYFLILSIMVGIAIVGNRTVITVSEQIPLKVRKCVIIDAGHGGVDGGAISYSGVLESQINLEIALILEDLFHLIGIDTLMIRIDDRSVYTAGNSISEKKISDLKERVRIVNGQENAILVSIHQNKFSDSRYSGAQVFYATTQGSTELARSLQSSLVTYLNPGSTRKTKEGQGIFLLEKIKCPGVLIECGFLSHPEEEAKLRSEEYQQKLCCVITAAVSQYLSNT